MSSASRDAEQASRARAFAGDCPAPSGDGLRRWFYALKPASSPKLVVPMLLGQALGVVTSGALDWGAALFGVLFTVLDLACIVLLNDWADREVDAIKRRRFPSSCSPKTIFDRVLPAEHVLIGGLLAGALALGAAFVAASLLDRPLLGLGALGCLGLFVAYSLPPIAANYRGGGELLEAAGVGAALPWLNAYAQSGEHVPQSGAVLLGFSVLALASAVASGLSDEQTDREGGKRTVVTELGNEAARKIVEAALLAGALLWILASVVARAPLAATLPAAGVVAWRYFGVRRHSPRATANAFLAQAIYKSELHRAVWWSALVLSAGLLTERFLLG